MYYFVIITLAILFLFLVEEFFRAVVAFFLIKYFANVRPRGWKKSRQGYIYAFTDVPYFFIAKIGRASNYNSRLNSHRTSAPFGVFAYVVYYVEDAVESEKLIHDIFRFERFNREWFFVSPAMLMTFILLRILTATFKYKKSWTYQLSS